MALKSYPVNLIPDPAVFPRDLFDARWKEPAVQARVASFFHQKVVSELVSTQAPPAQLEPDLEILRGWTGQKLCTERRTLLPSMLLNGGRRFRGSAVNELHRRYAFGGGKPTLNFHAQVVTAGLEASGLLSLRARVGRFGGDPGSAVLVAVRFYAGREALGGLAWRSVLGGTEDIDLQLYARSTVLASRLEALTELELLFGAAPQDIAEAQAPRARPEVDQVADLFAG